MLPETEMIFRCPVDNCRYESCRKCGEKSHIPLSCKEVEKSHETNARVSVEEAMTNARVRTCPKPTCKKRFYKIDGCNKITCSCRTLICYVCRSDITKVGYKHFCQKPHCKHENCNQCPLYSNAREDDLRSMRAAGLKAAENVRTLHLKKKNLSIDSNLTGQAVVDLKIDVDEILKDPANRQ